MNPNSAYEDGQPAMERSEILLPMMALIGWTLCVLLLIPYQRFRAAGAGAVTEQDFRLGESERVPPEVRIPNRNLMNLLELPVLFYAVCLVAYVTSLADHWTVRLAWVYVALRIAHSVVHLSYNKVMHRLAFFALSNFVLVAIWARLLLALT